MPEKKEKVKRCPFCGEEILAIAKKCKHCGSYLGKRQTLPKPTVDFGIFLLAIPVIATMLILFWVSGMNLLQSPDSKITIIMLATILGTALVAAMEANKIGMISDRKKGTYSPTAWFFIIALIWIIGYPVYLYKRKYYGLPNRLIAGILVALVSSGSCGVMGSAIGAKKAEVLGYLNQAQKRTTNRIESKESIITSTKSFFHGCRGKTRAILNAMYHVASAIDAFYSENNCLPDNLYTNKDIIDNLGAPLNGLKSKISWTLVSGGRKSANDSVKEGYIQATVNISECSNIDGKIVVLKCRGTSDGYLHWYFDMERTTIPKAYLQD